jgi:Molecular chaperone
MSENINNHAQEFESGFISSEIFDIPVDVSPEAINQTNEQAEDTLDKVSAARKEVELSYHEVRQETGSTDTSLDDNVFVEFSEAEKRGLIERSQNKGRTDKSLDEEIDFIKSESQNPKTTAAKMAQVAQSLPFIYPFVNQ